MKTLLRKTAIGRWLDDFTDTEIGRLTTILAVVIAIAMIWYWRTLK